MVLYGTLAPYFLIQFDKREKMDEVNDTSTNKAQAPSQGLGAVNSKVRPATDIHTDIELRVKMLIDSDNGYQNYKNAVDSLYQLCQSGKFSLASFPCIRDFHNDLAVEMRINGSRVKLQFHLETPKYVIGQVANNELINDLEYFWKMGIFNEVVSCKNFVRFKKTTFTFEQYGKIVDALKEGIYRVNQTKNAAKKILEKIKFNSNRLEGKIFKEFADRSEFEKILEHFRNDEDYQGLFEDCETIQQLVNKSFTNDQCKRFAEQLENDVIKDKENVEKAQNILQNVDKLFSTHDDGSYQNADAYLILGYVGEDPRYSNTIINKGMQRNVDHVKQYHKPCMLVGYADKYSGFGEDAKKNTGTSFLSHNEFKDHPKGFILVGETALENSFFEDALTSVVQNKRGNTKPWCSITEERTNLLNVSQRSHISHLKTLWEYHKSPEKNIIKILHDYTGYQSNFYLFHFALHWKRHYRSGVDKLIEDSKTKPAQEILNELKSRFQKMDPHGTLAATIHFIENQLYSCAVLEQKLEHEEQEAVLHKANQQSQAVIASSKVVTTNEKCCAYFSLR